MLGIRYSSQFKKDIRRLKRQYNLTGVTSLDLNFGIFRNLHYTFKGIQPENSKLKIRPPVQKSDIPQLPGM